MASSGALPQRGRLPTYASGRDWLPSLPSPLPSVPQFVLIDLLDTNLTAEPLDPQDVELNAFAAQRAFKRVELSGTATSREVVYEMTTSRSISI
jgi:hypothetical protein